MFNLEANAAGIAKIVFRRGGSVTAVTTSDSGTYEVELASGIYQVSTETRRAFCPVRRAEFELAPSARVELNLVVIPCGIADYIQYDEKGKYKGEFEVDWPPRSHDSFAVKKGKKTRHLVVLFAVRNQLGTEIQYLKSPPETKAQYPVPVLITYDLLTIRADEAMLNPKTMAVCAQGSLIVQDGARTTRPAAIALRLVDGQAVLQEQGSCPTRN